VVRTKHYCPIRFFSGDGGIAKSKCTLEHENKLLQQENLQLKQKISELDEQMEQDQELEESMDLH